MDISRRSFFTSSAVIIAAICGSAASQAQTTQAVTENDPAASALGFHLNASTVDKAKYPTYEAGQSCSGCAFFQADAGTTEGKCSMYGGRTVPSTAWCAAFFKRV
ncbi:MAG: high-potential iron-sulfur protein [Alphaproteobacteria bacterium]|nr:high-potential iron-sulfur protein [Alphaproteobacteria bacterium]